MRWLFNRSVGGACVCILFAILYLFLTHGRAFHCIMFENNTESSPKLTQYIIHIVIHIHSHYFISCV